MKRIVRDFRGCFCGGLVLAMAAGCAGPNPAQTRVSLISWYAPEVTVVLAGGCATNSPAADAWPRASGDANTQRLEGSMRGVMVAVDNTLALPVGSGTAASNSVLSGIEIPLVK